MPVIHRRTASEAAEQAIREYILKNNLSEGDPLPTEQEFSESFGISRNIVREAMGRFRSAGIIESKTRTGARIRRFTPENPYLAYMPFMAEKENSVRDLAGIRGALETGSVPYILAGRTPERLAALDLALERMLLARSEKERNRTDCEFHASLLRMTGNNLMESLLPLLVDFFSRVIGKTAHPRSQRSVDAEHKAIVRAVHAGDEKKLTSLLKKHAEHYLPR